MSRKPVTVQLPPAVAAEISDVVTRTQRSTAFVALRALTASPQPPPLPPSSERAPLALSTDDDDPPGTLNKINVAAVRQGRSLDDALAASWLATRERFQRWAEREVSLRSAERADDLDAGLREAADPSTSPARLSDLAASPYPRIRALVAAHAHTPADVRQRLSQDREPYVREAAKGT